MWGSGEYLGGKPGCRKGLGLGCRTEEEEEEEEEKEEEGVRGLGPPPVGRSWRRAGRRRRRWNPENQAKFKHSFWYLLILLESGILKF